MPEGLVLLRGVSEEGTFLGELPVEARDALLASATTLRVHAGGMIFAAGETVDRTGVVVEGLARTFLTAPDGRRASVRYARAGSLIGSLSDRRAPLSCLAVTDCVILEVSRSELLAAVAADGRVGLRLIAEISRRLGDTYATLSANTFGTMRERVARQLLDLTTEDPDTALLVAPVTQQALADGVGTVREVVARVLREFRDEGLVATNAGHIGILDPDGIASIVGRWR